jgi:hypothetical protein
MIPRQFLDPSLASKCSRGFPTDQNVHVWRVKFPHADQGALRARPLRLRLAEPSSLSTGLPAGSPAVTGPPIPAKGSPTRAGATRNPPAPRPPAPRPRAHVRDARRPRPRRGLRRLPTPAQRANTPAVDRARGRPLMNLSGVLSRDGLATVAGSSRSVRHGA